MNFQKGEVILINKPYKWTSFDVVNKVRNIIKKIPCNFPNQDEKILNPKIKVGHAGTLDPLATGLLIVCTGKLTKEIDTFQAQEKEYTGVFFIGATTPSYDLETAVDKEYETSHINKALIHEAVKKFIGKISQVPPSHSAIKIGGQRAYKKARLGETQIIQPKDIEISDFEITKIDMPLIYFRVVCSKGTYIRSLANDFGNALFSGAYLQSLCRTRIGDFKLDKAMTIDEFMLQYQLVQKEKVNI